MCVYIYMPRLHFRPSFILKWWNYIERLLIFWVSSLSLSQQIAQVRTVNISRAWSQVWQYVWIYPFMISITTWRLLIIYYIWVPVRVMYVKLKGIFLNSIKCWREMDVWLFSCYCEMSCKWYEVPYVFRNWPFLFFFGKYSKWNG